MSMLISTIYTHTSYTGQVAKYNSPHRDKDQISESQAGLAKIMRVLLDFILSDVALLLLTGPCYQPPSVLTVRYFRSNSEWQ